MSFAPDYAATAFWNEDSGFPRSSEAPLPASADVVIVGAGYTGLAAARETGLAGKSTIVFDAGPIGGGCSSRNGGQVGFSIRPEFEALARRHGQGIATAIYREGLAAVADLRALARTPGFDCDWRGVGCFYGAHTRHHFELLRRSVESQPAGLEQRILVVPPEEQAAEIGSSFYHGGLVYPDDAAIHPLRLLNALYARACSAGAVAHADCPVLALERTREGFTVHTPRGTVRGRQVLIATNGYTGALSPWHRRRVVPIGSYIIATEPLDPALVARLIPHGRNLVDTRHVVVYVRPSPDGRRILFGGRAAAKEQDVSRCVPRLAAMMTEVFPELGQARISRAWMGFVAFTFDSLPHLGSRDGLFYCMGYCGAGIPLATYYGRKIGLQMAGAAGGDTALDGLPFPARPLYFGRPWFMPAAILGYRMRDRLGW
ncbi:MAG TPA: FAD-binding oxidoreductase [Steroidobacteraceae bacterium]|nr:FAD-binding oxidoreductase [Steroidobacteraceae bacterium]